MFDFLGCNIDVPAEQMSAIVRTESSANQYAVGIVGHKINRQPQTLEEAIELVNTLRNGGYNYSVGLAQVNQVNFSAYGLSDTNMFDSCTNLSVGSKILKACYDKYDNWQKAYSCYYSGNATTGFKHGYVSKVLSNMNKPLLSSISSVISNSSPIIIKQRGGGKTEFLAPTLSVRRLQSELQKITSSQVEVQNTETEEMIAQNTQSLSSRRLQSSLSN